MISLVILKYLSSMSGMEHIIYLFNFPHKATLPPLFDKPINWMSRRGIFHCTLSEIKSWNRQNWAHIKKRKLNKLDQKDGVLGRFLFVCFKSGSARRKHFFLRHLVYYSWWLNFLGIIEFQILFNQLLRMIRTFPITFHYFFHSQVG